jgi:hypothetical protein
MVTPIDVVRSGMGFDQAGRWHEARASFQPASRRAGEEDPIAPARGAIFGLLISGAGWIGVIAAVKTVADLF